jgi:hypothetical protein
MSDLQPISEINTRLPSLADVESKLCKLIPALDGEIAKSYPEGAIPKEIKAWVNVLRGGPRTIFSGVLAKADKKV